MDWPISVGDEITYHQRARRAKIIEKDGIVVDLTDTVAVIRLARYRDTILRADLITGAVKITTIKKGEDIMGNANKLEVPPAEKLAELYAQADGNISKAAQMNEPPVSDATMGKWLRQAGIIPASGRRSKKEALCTGEQAAGITTETADSNPARPDEGKEGTNGHDDEPNRDHEIIKKLIDFSLAPMQGRLDKLEMSLAAVAKMVIDMDKSKQDTDSLEATMDLLAELIVRILGRVDNARTGKVDRQSSL